MPQLLDATVREETPLCLTAWMRFMGTPQSPNPPTSKKEPCLMPLMASYALEHILENRKSLFASRFVSIHFNSIIFTSKYMSNSPNRNYLTHRRDHPDHPESTINRYQNQSLHSPLISSPHLNDEDEGDIRLKLDMLLKHNSQLLNENAQLSEMVNGLRMDCQELKRKELCCNMKTVVSMETVMLEMETANKNHERETQKLLLQISKLHQQAHQQELNSKQQLRRQQEALEKKMVIQLNQAKRGYDDNRELMDLQVKRLKQSLEQKEYQYEELRTRLKREVEEAKAQCELFKKEIEHQRKLTELEKNELIRKGKDELKIAVRDIENEKSLQMKSLDNKVLKLKRELLQKDKEIGQICSKSVGESEQIFSELEAMKREREKMSEELEEVVRVSKEKIIRDKQRLQQMSDMEKQNMSVLFENQRDSLRSDKMKLQQLCFEKAQEIKKVYLQMNEIRENGGIERSRLDELIEEMRMKNRQLERERLEEMELLKIKMAELHQNDLVSLELYYQGELTNVMVELQGVKQNVDRERERVYDLMGENDQLRRTFELEVSKQKARLQDMKVKFASARLEFREQITSLGTKMELTSQTLVRQTDQKQKGVEFFEVEKKKFYAIIESKDREIQTLQEGIDRIKSRSDQQQQLTKAEIDRLREDLILKEKQLKHQRAGLEEQFQRKSLKIIEQVKSNENLELPKEHEALKIKFQELEKELFKKSKEIQFLARENKSMQQQIGLRAGFLETMQLESSAAIEDEKSKIKILMGKNEVDIKDYYEGKLDSREKDNEHLKQLLAEKENEIRQLVHKYAHLEKKLKELMTASNKLREMEEKISSLGMDQNLVKNMAELFRKRA